MSLLALLFALGVALGQGVFQASVVNFDGQPAPGVEVTLTSAAPFEPRTAWTDANGAVRFDGLPFGVYLAESEAVGWAQEQLISVTREDLLVVGEREVIRTMDLVLAEPAILSMAVATAPCVWAFGVAANATPSGRGWDLGTSGPLASSVSPVLSRQCRVGRIWASIDLAPWLRHTYAGGQRASLGLSGSAGYALSIGRLDAVPFVSTQGATWGGGLRLAIPVGPVTLESRVAVLSGKNPDVQGWLLVSPRRQNGKVARALSSGLALGTFVGYDRGIYKWFGVRGGLLTSPLSDTVLQPTLLADATVKVYRRFSITPAFGASWREASVQPLGGLRVELQRAVRMHAGVLVGPGTGGVVVPDVGVTVGW
ncbi:MAG: carboxypeptidase regulatory-like domain-containing protein [Proteobacteria bacterium]|nr:carboxypeptidase regulatory-like domain-containing protein [Pseudomonadota bacterium]